MAFRTLQENVCPPLSEDTFEAVKSKFLCNTASNRETDLFLRMCKGSVPPGLKHKIEQVTVKVVDKRLRNLRATSHPGPSKARNSHILLLLKTPWGKRILQAWAQAWTAGTVPPKVRLLWTRGTIKPLSKDEGQGVRPITLFECPFKVATGFALDIHKKEIITAVGNFQYGALLKSAG